MGLRHSFTCPYPGQAILCVKKWFEAQISGTLPDVFSYISHFVCLYNFSYTGRPLRGPGITGIIYQGPVMQNMIRLCGVTKIEEYPL